MKIVTIFYVPEVTPGRAFILNNTAEEKKEQSIGFELFYCER